MSKLSNEQLTAFLLRKLARRGYWGGRHTNIARAYRLNGRENIEASKRIVGDLIKEKWLMAKPTSYGTEVSLNPRLKAQIERYVESVLGG